MMIHFRYRSAALVALAISLAVFAGFPQLAGAAAKSDAATAKGRATAPGYAKKLPPPDAAAVEEAQPSAGTPTAADHPEGYSTHDQTNGPGGQVCDGDPSNAPGAGGNYENTCDAGPSQNGVGDGKATGKPCAGCVGNADDKNPKGQASSGPTDHNNGYECDQKGRSANEGNNGVGYGNPAHTGCTSTTPPLATCPDGSAMPASGDVKDCGPKPPTCPDGSPMPASGKVKDCTPKPPTCPGGSAMPASGNVKDCTPKPPTCPDGSAMPASGNVKDCAPTCPDGSAMPASGNVKDCTPKPPTCPGGSAMPSSGNVKDCAPTCPDGSAMPTSGDVEDCAPTCPDGSAMPTSGSVGDCSPAPRCTDGSTLPAVGTGTCPEPCPSGTAMPAGATEARDCLPTCPDGAAMGQGSDAATCAQVLGAELERPTQVLGVQLERRPSGVLAFTGGAHLGGLLQLAGLLGLVGGGLTTIGRRRRDDDAVDIRSRLQGHC